MSTRRTRQHRGLHAGRGAARDRADGRDPRRARDRDGAMAAELEPRLRARAARRDCSRPGSSASSPTSRRPNSSPPAPTSASRCSTAPSSRSRSCAARSDRTRGPASNSCASRRPASDKGLTTVRTRARFLPIGRDGIDAQPAPVRSGRAGARALSRHVLLCGTGPRLAQRLARRGRSCRARSACSCATPRPTARSRFRPRRWSMPTCRPTASSPKSSPTACNRTAATPTSRSRRCDHASAALRSCCSCASGHDGFIIVAVLWILAALATLATIFSVYVDQRGERVHGA